MLRPRHRALPRRVRSAPHSPGRYAYAPGVRRAAAPADPRAAFLTASKTRLRGSVSSTSITTAKSLVESVRSPYLTGRELSRTVTVEGLEHLDAAVRQERGLTLADDPFGNYYRRWKTRPPAVDGAAGGSP